MDRFVKKIQRNLGEEVAKEYVQEVLSKKRTRPWMGWSAAKKRSIAEQLHQSSYPHMKVCSFPLRHHPLCPLSQTLLGADCPPVNTIKGWRQAGERVRRPGRPTLLTQEEEQTVLDSFRTVRQIGSSVDYEGLSSLALKTTTHTRYVRLPSPLSHSSVPHSGCTVEVSRSWGRSFSRRWGLPRMQLMGERCGSQPSVA